MLRNHSLTRAALTAASLTALGALTVPPAVHAQAAAFPDVDANHWAYQAVQDLAAKGYVKGYPDGKFLGGRTMTRYEFATVIDRIVQTIDALSTKVNAPPVTPTGTAVTQDDLNKINALVDTFRGQLDAIQSQINGDPAKGTKGFQEQLDALRQDVTGTKAQLAKTTDTANNSYGSGTGRKFAISGFIQTRFAGGPRSKSLYPQGSSAKQGSYNGNYAQGANPDGFQVRRARLKFVGEVTPNTKYTIQIDASGAITSGTAANQQVSVREGNIAYTFGSGDPAKNPTLTAGLFIDPFGFMLPQGSAVSLATERPLAFNEGVYGLFNTVDFDKGVQFSTALPTGRAPLRATVALTNGSGRTTEEVDRRLSQVYRLAYQSKDKVVGAGVSYYNGQINAPTTVNGATGTGLAYVGRKRQLFGVDAQFTSPAGPFALAEYVGGTFEQRTFFPTFGILATTTDYAPGNKVSGYYVQGGYTFSRAGRHPLTLFVNFDTLERASGGPGSNSAYDDENLGYGALYNLDKATRLRVYYIRPSKVAHAPNTLAPPNIALTTAELQVRF
ncbi:MAG: porin [Armatimonadota bacterium]|nr:porin [Armatimonadota bacterium]